MVQHLAMKGGGGGAGGKIAEWHSKEFTQLAEGLLEYMMVGWALLTTEADCTATVSLLKVSSPKTGCRIFSTSKKTSSGGGTALILWALPWLAYFSTTGMLSSLKVLNLQEGFSQLSCTAD